MLSTVLNNRTWNSRTGYTPNTPLRHGYCLLLLFCFCDGPTTIKMWECLIAAAVVVATVL